jgi:hypothetical protein
LVLDIHVAGYSAIRYTRGLRIAAYYSIISIGILIADANEIEVLVLLAACDCAYEEKRLSPGCNRFGQRGVWRLVGEILLASEEPYEGPPLLCDTVANGSAQHRVRGLKGIEYRLRCDWRLHF